VMDQSSLKDE